jgi:hypothetical protein
VSHLLLDRQALSVTRKQHEKLSRRHTEAAGNLLVLLVNSTAYLRRRFSFVVTTTLAIIRFKSRRAKRSQSKKSGEEEEEPLPPPTPTPVLVHCGICNRTHDLSSAPDVVRSAIPFSLEFSVSPGIDLPVAVRRRPTDVGR